MSVHSTNQAKPDQTDTRGIILTMVSSESIVEENTIVHNVFIENTHDVKYTWPCFQIYVLRQSLPTSYIKERHFKAMKEAPPQRRRIMGGLMLGSNQGVARRRLQPIWVSYHRQSHFGFLGITSRGRLQSPHFGPPTPILNWSPGPISSTAAPSIIAQLVAIPCHSVTGG